MTDSLIITDTGKRSTASASAEETDKANSGTAFTLQGVELTVNYESSLNTTPVLGKFATAGDAATKWDFGEVSTIGFHKPKWTARGVLDDRSATDMAKVAVLSDLPRTKGYKTLGGDLPDWVDGSNNASTVNVHIKNVKIIHKSKSNIVDYTIEMYETE